MIRRIYDWTLRLTFWFLLSVLAQWGTIQNGIWHPAYLYVLNSIGPSTEYHYPEIGTATRKEDGRNYVYIGDEFYVWVWVVRHKTNGNCIFDIRRYAEVTEGASSGTRYLISKESLQFVGQNELRRTRWPQPPSKIFLGYAVDEDNEPINGNSRDERGYIEPARPLLPDGVEQLSFDFYVVGRYFCNALDYVMPRYIQGGLKPNETERVHAILKRTKP